MKPKKMLALIMVLVMGMMLIACSGDPGNKAPEGSSDAGDDGKITIGITLMAYNHPFFQDMLAMAKKTAADLGVEIIDLDGGGDVQKQLEGIEDLISGAKIDALCLNPVDSAAIVPAVEAANAAGIPVITIDVRSEDGDIVAHVSSNNLEIGTKQGEYAVEKLREKNGSEKGTVLIIGFPQITSMRERAEGFKEVLSQYPDIEIVEQNAVQMTIESAQTTMEDLQQKYTVGKIDLVYGTNADMGLGALAAEESANRNDYMVFGVDDNPEILAALQDPNSQYTSTVIQSPTDMAKIGVELAVKAAKGEAIDKDYYPTELILCNKDTVADYMAKYNATQKMLEPYK